jgi:L-aspartate oxidase
MPAETTARDAHIFDIVILGGGIAGLSLALSLPERLRVAVLTKSSLGESNTRYAQGGLAAAMGDDDDPELHLRDTLAAGAGLVDERAARVLVSEAREAVAWLVSVGARFDEGPGSLEASSHATTETTRFDLTREAAHSRRRVLHAHDATGAEVERALVAAVRARNSVVVLEHTLARDLLVEDGVCAGVDAVRDGQWLRLLARRGIVLANGGAGQLWLRTSNPAGATADGFALAWRAGATLADMEFAQFHPTVLVPPGGDGEAFLISEAVRGEGALLRNAAGKRFMLRYAPEAELAPRDVVARAILSEMLAEEAPSAFLDLRHLRPEETRERFPSIATVCQRYGLDLTRDLIPVAPAAHYFMGGVLADTWARTSVPALYAVGEVACTGVHGANRLASNSLLEGLVFGRRAARALADGARLAEWPRGPALPGDQIGIVAFEPMRGQVLAPRAAETRAAVRRVMWQHVSLHRDATGLALALEALRTLAADPSLAGIVDPETANMLLVAQLVTAAAQTRTESRGGHFRVDFPARAANLDGRHTLLAAAETAAAVTATREEASARG